MVFSEEWIDDFGALYVRLRLARDYLTRTHRIEFPNKRLQRQKAEQRQKERIERNLREFVIAAAKFEQRHPKIIEFLHNFERAMEVVTPSFENALNAVSQHKQNVSCQRCACMGSTRTPR